MTATAPTLDSLYFTPAELARLYKVSERTVWRWDADAEIRRMKVGQTVRYALEAVIDFELRHTLAARSQANPDQVKATKARLESIARQIAQQREAA